MVLDSISKARCDITSYLENYGPTLSSTIVDYLHEKCGINEAAARQRVSRAPSNVLRLSNIGLPDRVAFLYLSEHEGTELLRQRLATAFIKKKANAGVLLLSIIGRGGCAHAKHLPIISGAPLTHLRGHPTASTVIDTLLRLRLIEETAHDEYGRIYSSNYQTPIPHNEYVAYCNIEKIMIECTQSWLARLNFCVNSSSRFSHALPDCNGFGFDIVGKAKLRHFFSERNQSSDAYVVCDVNLIKEKLSLDDMLYFTKKIEIASYSRVKQNIIPFFFAYDFTLDTIRALKKYGIIHARIRHVFGEEFAELLKHLHSILSNISKALQDNPEQAGEIVSGILRVEGRSYNLRSVAFQFIVSQFIHFYGFRIDINKQIRTSSGQQAEIDVFADRNDLLYCIECKAFSPKNECGHEHVNSWIKEKLPRVVAWKREAYGNRKTKVVFCVSTTFRDRNLIAIPQTRDDISFELWDSAYVTKGLKDAKLEKTLTLFNEHFSKGYI